MKAYIPNLISELKEFYKDYLHDLASYSNIPTHLDALAQRMHIGIKENQPSILSEISNYHKDYLGKIELIDPQHFSLNDCRQTIAHEYGFTNWKTLSNKSDLQYNYKFEKAINHLLEGNLTALKNLITNNPDLLTARSKYGHQATLLNYAGSNGVEFWRQQVPLNLPELVLYLLEAGADKTATMKVYGGEFNTYELLSTSIHPLKAGLMDEMKSILAPSH